MNQYADNQYREWLKRNAAARGQGYVLAYRLTSSGLADSSEPTRIFVTEVDRDKFLAVSPQWRSYELHSI
jgi:hypothetical protein